jgi:hypothetical protein
MRGVGKKTLHRGVEAKQRLNQGDWEAAEQAAIRLSNLLSREVGYLRTHHGFRNAYLPFAFLRFNRLITTLDSGMECMRMVFEGKTNYEIQQSTGLSVATIAAYKAWNTMYSRNIHLLLASKANSKRRSAKRPRSRMVARHG